MKNKKDTPRRLKHPAAEDRASEGARWLHRCLAALVTVLIVELLNQGSFPELWSHITQRPAAFALDYMVILSSLSLGELIHRRLAWLGSMTLLWIGFGIANRVCIASRTTPLLPGDLLLSIDLIRLSTVYYKWYEIAAMVLGILAIIALVIFMILRAPRRKKVNYRTAVTSSLVVILITVCAILVGENTGLITNLENRVEAYHTYGFPVCFVSFMRTPGVKQPETYSADAAEEIITEAREEVVPAATTSVAREGPPNLIFVQLESFIDPETIKGAEFSRDPVPNYRKLLETCPNATLYMPSVGGGTSNAEFEVLTGMNVDFFAAGETTYHTIIQQKTCESLAYILRGHEYTSTAIHANTGTFYFRNTVYANLGFDRFIPIEYMPEIDYASNGWARDVNLIPIISDTLKASNGPDLIFTITVESHGKYADEYEYKDGDVIVENLPENGYENATRNYVQLLTDVDTFIGELTDTLSKSEEPTIVIFYGDHLPGLGLEAEMLTTKDLYATHYVIWNNYGAKFTAANMQAYRLGPDIMRQLGIDDGIVNLFQQSRPVDSDSESDYMNALQTLQYDMLYGEQASYGEDGPYEPTDLILGLKPVAATSAKANYGRLLVTGSEFNEFSKIVCGDTVYPTAFVNSGQIVMILSDAETLAEDTISVAQIAPNGTELGRTDSVTVEK